MKPRLTLVTVVEVKTGAVTTDEGIIIPAEVQREYKKCEIVKVGPGVILNKDDLSVCRDLKPGQIVLVKLAREQRINQDMVGLESIGVALTSDDGRALKLVDHSQIVLILHEPGEVTTVEKKAAAPTPSKIVIPD